MKTVEKYLHKYLGKLGYQQLSKCKTDLINTLKVYNSLGKFITSQRNSKFQFDIHFYIFIMYFCSLVMILTLAPNAEPYVFETGDVKQLINLGGTIPILHKHQTLHISVKVTRHWPNCHIVIPCWPGLAGAGLPRVATFLLHYSHQGHRTFRLTLPQPFWWVGEKRNKDYKYFIFFSRTDRASLYGWVEPQKHRLEYILANSKVLFYFPLDISSQHSTQYVYFF